MHISDVCSTAIFTEFIKNFTLVFYLFKFSGSREVQVFQDWLKTIAFRRYFQYKSNCKFFLVKYLIVSCFEIISGYEAPNLKAYPVFFWSKIANPVEDQSRAIHYLDWVGCYPLLGLGWIQGLKKHVTPISSVANTRIYDQKKAWE